MICYTHSFCLNKEGMAQYSVAIKNYFVYTRVRNVSFVLFFVFTHIIFTRIVAVFSSICYLVFYFFKYSRGTFNSIMLRCAHYLLFFFFWIFLFICKSICGWVCSTYLEFLTFYCVCHFVGSFPLTFGFLFSCWISHP